MRVTKLIMGMPITVEIHGHGARQSLIEKVFDYFREVDEKFSTYKSHSEISRFNRGEISQKNFSPEMWEVFGLAEETKKLTSGYFDIQTPGGVYDPSGLVKGWAILRGAEILKLADCKNYYVEAGGDIQAGIGRAAEKWTVGIRNPFNQKEIVKAVKIGSHGMATSGSYERGAHIYNPHKPGLGLTEVVSLTVIGPDVYQADRFATAAFAMGPEGINFIEAIPDLEGYMINKNRTATMTSGFEKYLS